MRAIHQLAKGLGVDTVVEGCETEAQLEFLLEEGMRLIQGFYYGKPETGDVVAQRWLL